MKSLLVELDEATLDALNRIAPPDRRQRSEFVRQAIRAAIREAEYAAMKEAYLRQPDSERDAGDWSTAKVSLKDGKQNHQLRSQIEKESAWLAKNRDAYRGRWIALEGDRLLASGPTSKEVFSMVADRTPPPLVIHIPMEDLPFAGW